MYNVKNCFQSKEKKEKIKQYYFNNFGVIHNMQLDTCKEKRVKTYLKNYNVDNPSKCYDIKKKKEETCLKNYNVKSPLQNKIIFFKNKYNHLKLYKYKNTDIFYQSTYELDFLKKYFDSLKINQNITIKYNMNNLIHTYYPDFFIEDLNLIVEIKSSFTYNKEFYKNQIKLKSCLEQDFNFIFIIDKNYDFFNNYIKNHHADQV